MKKIVSIILMLPFVLLSQDTITIAAYNLLYYDDAIDRNADFRIVINEILPDILVVQEIESQQGVDNFLNSVLNYTSPNNYSSADFIYDSNLNNALFYHNQKFSFISNTAIPTSSRDINQFRLIYLPTGDTLDFFGLHLKSSQGTSNQNIRSTQIDSLRKVTNSLMNPYFMVLGDFNIYSTNEQAYQKLFDSSVNSTGRFNDVYSFSGTMNTSSFAYAHTQSSRTRNFGGGASGGLDDRFDMILFSDSLISSSTIYLLPNSYIPFGNDSQHYNDSINSMPNSSVSQNVANALHYASDHLPVVCKVVFSNAANTSNIQGEIEYYNSNTSINLARIFLKDMNGNILDSIETTDGLYSFNNVFYGDYIINTEVLETWGGVNSSDALLIQHHSVGINTLNPFYTVVADVNASQSVNTTDALLTRMRFTNMIDSFDIGDWVIENDTIHINSINTNFIIKINCAADVNSSYSN